MIKRLLLPLFCLTLAFSAHAANDINTLQNLVQNQFKGLSEDLSAGLSYKSMAAAEPSGVTGFEVGADVIAIDLSNSQAWSAASNNSSVNTVALPKLYASKGLPANIDIEAAYSEAPNSNIALWGGAIKYAFLEGSVTTPAIAVRAALSGLNGVSQLDYSSNSIELLASKGFINMTPYIGIGQVWSSVKPKGIPLLSKEDISQTRIFAGINFSLTVVKLGLYADQTGDTTSYGLHLGVGL